MYCPRRFYYEFALGEMLINEHVLAGRVHHQVADAGAAQIVDDTVKLRSVYVYSDRLRISGVIDVVEAPLSGAEGADEDEHATPPITAVEEPLRAEIDVGSLSETVGAQEGDGSLYPVEYKKGSTHGGGAHDHVQLCAQGLCLEERLGRRLAGGYVFSFQSRRRTWIPFTPVLRAQTEEAIQRAFALVHAGRLPPPLPVEQDRKCRACSLEPLCLPNEVRALSALGQGTENKGSSPNTSEHLEHR